MAITAVLLIPQLVSCSKEGATPNTANAYLNIVNLSPDIRPFNLYAEFLRQGTTQYSYPNASGYFLQNIADTPLQIRSAVLNIIDTLNFGLGRSLNQNVRYTWFITGLRGDSSISSILTVDSGSAPGLGRSKVRLVNASPGSVGLSLFANDSLAFSNITYKKVSDYREVTSGSYNFKLTTTNAPGVALTTLRNLTVLDGKLYTIYTYGLLNRTDTSSFSANIILNTIPDKK